MRLLVTRPAEDTAALLARLRAAGHEAVAAPVMAIRPVPGAALDLAGVQALLVTSRNGVRALAAATPERALPVLAVGEASAEAARAAGFAEVRSAEGDVAGLARLVSGTIRPGSGPLVHVAGSVQAGDLAGLLTAQGYAVRRAVLYEARPVDRLPVAAAAFLGEDAPGGVLFYSPRSAALFGVLAEQAGLRDRLKPLTAFCLSAAVAEAARSAGFGRLAVATQPDQDALLALLPHPLEPGQRPS